MKNKNLLYQIDSFESLAYYNGTEEPTPGKQKYKPEDKILDKARFKEPFYRNYDLYNTEGEHSPGAGYHDLQKFKSVKEFLEHKRKKNKQKYKAEVFEQKSDGKKVKKSSSLKRLEIYNLIKQGIDFQSDDYKNFVGDSSFEFSDASPSGYLDPYLMEDDDEGKSPDKLDFGYNQNEAPISSWEPILDKYLNEFLDMHQNSEFGSKNHGRNEYDDVSYA
jgi:hypothetical protein